MLVLRRDVNVLLARTTGVNEGYHGFFMDKLRLRFPRLHQRRLDGTIHSLFEVIAEWYEMRIMRNELGALHALLFCACRSCHVTVTHGVGCMSSTSVSTS